MTITNPGPTCWIIDPSLGAAENLCDLLRTGGYGEVLGTSASVADWPGGPVDCLFIRITAWDDFLEWRVLRRAPDPGTVIFLSGQFEKCTQHLGEDLDFYLKPPFRTGRIARVMWRRTDPRFQRRPLDFFFLKVDYRFEIIQFPELLYVKGNGGGRIQIRTVKGDFTVLSTLAALSGGSRSLCNA